ncbi:uncharacterized protein K452DRAFT_132175 [Aplosporella prunicola CBS 121167]|uniref:Uncharacterized protein n=1 Tax=Aplosporella prunicola CBS 121167 TaxID=1176127 RepID=A0A6A6BLC1_9PEZI|nr:uncharacterized protein K452DRAFT_132175 [Aplosporella prunicola CBS 121167]KAF2144919.1 hypothetical protein K452DRAFT_132175 [Aplosporella prunicola CBS 121167]
MVRCCCCVAFALFCGCRLGLLAFSWRMVRFADLLFSFRFFLCFGFLSGYGRGPALLHYRSASLFSSALTPGSACCLYSRSLSLSLSRSLSIVHSHTRLVLLPIKLAHSLLVLLQNEAFPSPSRPRGHFPRCRAAVHIC